MYAAARTLADPFGPGPLSTTSRRKAMEMISAWMKMQSSRLGTRGSTISMAFTTCGSGKLRVTLLWGYLEEAQCSCPSHRKRLAFAC